MFVCVLMLVVTEAVLQAESHGWIRVLNKKGICWEQHKRNTLSHTNALKIIPLSLISIHYIKHTRN